jgi:hypothetical protein
MIFPEKVMHGIVDQDGGSGGNNVLSGSWFKGQ